MLFCAVLLCCIVLYCVVLCCIVLVCVVSFVCLSDYVSACLCVCVLSCLCGGVLVWLCVCLFARSFVGLFVWLVAGMCFLFVCVFVVVCVYCGGGKDPAGSGIWGCQLSGLLGFYIG